MEIETLIEVCTRPNPPTNGMAIKSLQVFLGLRFPEDYVSYLLQQNGGFFRNVLIKTPWHPLSGDQLGSVYYVDIKRVEKSWESPEESADDDEYLLDDAIGCIQSVFLLQNGKPIRYLPIASTELGHLILMVFTDGTFDRMMIKGAFIDEPLVYCNSFEELLQRFLG